MSDQTEESRKAEEAEFHDRLRAIYESDPQLHARYTSNQKFYSVARSSSAYFDEWVRVNCPGKRVLDFGCGSGQLSVAAAEVAGHVTGIDISGEAIRLAEERARVGGVADKTTFLVMDGEATSFESGTFDVVLVSGVLHHMNLGKALSEMARVLRQDGRAIMLEALRDNPVFQLYRRLTPNLRTRWEVDHILGASAVDLVRSYFTEADVRFFHLLVLLAVPFRNTAVFNPLLRALDSCDRLLLSVPGLRRQAWMACITAGGPRSPQSAIRRH